MIINNFLHSAPILADGCEKFRQFLVEGTRLNRKKIAEYVGRSLMLVTALAPGDRLRQGLDDRASCRLEHDLTLKQAALQLGFDR